MTSLVRSFAVFLAATTLEVPTWPQTAAFEGTWKVMLNCPPVGGPEGAKGYTYRFQGEVQNGTMRAELGKAGEPGWQYLHGAIGADGNAVLTRNGIVGSADYAIGRSPAGNAFTYAVRARFDSSSGEG